MSNTWDLKEKVSKEAMNLFVCLYFFFIVFLNGLELMLF